MKISFLCIFYAIVSFVMTSCAAGYKSIKPETINYGSHYNSNGINFSYKYDVLRTAGNRKYAKYEDKKLLNIIAVKITNNTTNTINLARDIDFYLGNRIVIPMEPDVVKLLFKQNVPIYLLYLLYTPTIVYRTKKTSDGMLTTQTFPIGLFIGPTLTAYNMIKAGSANKKFYNELLQYDLNRRLAAGQTGYVLLALRNTGHESVSIRLKN